MTLSPDPEIRRIQELLARVVAVIDMAETLGQTDMANEGRAIRDDLLVMLAYRGAY